MKTVIEQMDEEQLKRFSRDVYDKLDDEVRKELEKKLEKEENNG